MVGKQIKRYLLDNGIKQSFVAEKTGYSPMVIANICSGNRKLDVVEYAKICNALNVPLGTFLGEEE